MPITLKKDLPSTRELLVYIILALIGFWWMGHNGHPLSQYDTTPFGILQLELPWRGVDFVQRVLSDWGQAGRELAWQNCCWDFGFIVIYTLAFSKALLWIAAHKQGKLAKVAHWLAGIAWWPAILDIIENAGMMYWLNTASVPSWTVRMVLAASAFKWLLVFMILGTGLWAIFSRGKKRDQGQ